MTASDVKQNNLPTDVEIEKGYDLLQLTYQQRVAPEAPSGLYPYFERCTLLKDIRTTTAAHTGV